MKYRPGDRITVCGETYVVIAVRRYLASAKRLAATSGARWTLAGSQFLIVRPAGQMPGPAAAEHPAMREAMA